MSVSETYEADSIGQVEANVFAFIGLPASGKSTALDVVSGMGSYPMTDEVSNYVRFRYENEVGGETDDNGLGRWAAEQKEEHGNGYFVDQWCRTIKGDQQAAHELDAKPWDPIALAGIRSPAELDALREHFTDVTSVVVWAMPDVRYDRITERDGDEMDRDVFEERQARELHDWGAKEFFLDRNYYDYIIPNNHDSVVRFERDVEMVVDENPIADKFKTVPWPDAWSDETLLENI
jgi:dephospho-CoA kinase